MRIAIIKLIRFVKLVTLSTRPAMGRILYASVSGHDK